MQAVPASRAYWSCQLAGWGGYAVLAMLAAVQLGGVSWARAAAELLPLCGGALLLTHLWRDAMRRRDWQRLRLRALLPRLLASSLLLGLLPGTAFYFSASGEAQRVGADLTLSPLWAWLNQVVNWASLFAGWAGVYFAVLAARRRQRAELRQSELQRALQAAELGLLKAQLNPHFLFNALNSIRALISEDPARAQDAVTRLASTLRHSLAVQQNELVTLDHELNFVGDYLALESLRLEDRLRVEYRIEEAARGQRLPSLLLQGLVENAIKHGLAELPAGGTLSVAARCVQGQLLLEVCNPRPDRPGAVPGHGLGLRNAAERLRLLFGEQAGIALDLGRPGLAVARAHLPARA